MWRLGPVRIAALRNTVIGVGVFLFFSFFSWASTGVASAAPAAVAPPTSPAAEAARREEAKAAFGRGNAAYNLGKYQDAIAEFEKAYALSRLPDILFNLGQCYRKLWEAEPRAELGRRALHYYEALAREAP